jgi:hypothetical protein
MQRRDELDVGRRVLDGYGAAERCRWIDGLDPLTTEDQRDLDPVGPLDRSWRHRSGPEAPKDDVLEILVLCQERLVRREERLEVHRRLFTLARGHEGLNMAHELRGAILEEADEGLLGVLDLVRFRIEIHKARSKGCQALDHAQDVGGRDAGLGDLLDLAHEQGEHVVLRAVGIVEVAISGGRV